MRAQQRIELMNVNVQDFPILRPAVNVVGPNKPPQPFSADTRVLTHGIENHLFNVRQSYCRLRQDRLAALGTYYHSRSRLSAPSFRQNVTTDDKIDGRNHRLPPPLASHVPDDEFDRLVAIVGGFVEPVLSQIHRGRVADNSLHRHSG